MTSARGRRSPGGARQRFAVLMTLTILLLMTGALIVGRNGGGGWQLVMMNLAVLTPLLFALLMVRSRDRDS